MIDLLDIDELIIMKERKKYLDMHPYAVWQSKDGQYWHTTFPDESKDRGIKQVKRKKKKDLEDLIVDFWKARSEYKTVADVFAEWNTNRLELKKIVQSTYVGINCIYKRHFGSISEKPIDEMKPIDWSDFLEQELVKHELTKDMFINLKGVVSGVIKWAFKRGYIQYSMSTVNDLIDISSKAYRDNHKEDEEEVYSEDETPLIIEYLINHPTLINYGFLLMFVTGVRIGELITLKHGDFSGNLLKIRRTRTTIINDNGKIARGVKDSPKSKCGIRDIVAPREYQWLMDYFANGDPDEFIFVNENGNLYRGDLICRRLRKVCDDLGIPYRPPHKIRKTYTSILLDNNVDSRFVIEQVGHSTIACTENFYHKNRKNSEKRTEIIDNVKEFKKHPSTSPEHAFDVKEA